MDPAELLEWGFQGGKQTPAGHRRTGWLIIGKIEAVVEGDEIPPPGLHYLNRETHQVGFRLIHIHAEKAHALAAPELNPETLCSLRYAEVVHRYPRGISRV